MVAELSISRKSGEEQKTELIIYPGIQRNAETHPASESERDEIFRHLENISPQKIRIDEKGVVNNDS